MMPDSRIEKAAAIVGKNEDDDYILKPERHAALFSDSIPEPARILRSSDFIFFSIAAFIFSFLATTHIKLVENMKLLEKWMRRRADAEMQRRDDFHRFVSFPMPPADKAEPVLLRLVQLEFFRRFQLDMQLSDYTQKGYS
jgi:hypothetical protein